VKTPEALIHFNLAAVAKAPISLQILAAVGSVVRTLDPQIKTGLNRVHWDLHYDSPRLIALRTRAPNNARVWLDPRFRDVDSRPITHWGIEPAEVGPIVAPGRYTVQLTIDEQRYSESFNVVPDPHASGSVEDIRQSVDLLLRIRDDISQVSDAVNQIEWLRKQLEVIEAMLGPSKKVDKATLAPTEENGDDADAVPPRAPPRALSVAAEQERAAMLLAAQTLDGQLRAVENRYVAEALRNSDDKYFVDAHRLYLDLLWLNAEVGTGGGDVAGSANFAPTDTQRELLADFEAQMQVAAAELSNVLEEGLAVANRTLTEGQLAPVVRLH
jgi:hypothetical protein